MEDSRSQLLISLGFRIFGKHKESFTTRGTYISISLIDATLVTDVFGNTLIRNGHVDVAQYDFIPREGILEAL